jgi:hypothetical protein
MKRIRFFLYLAALVFAGIMFPGCPTEPETGGVEDLGNPDGPIVILQDGPTRYYSLATGQGVSDPASQNWDIAFHYDRLIYTNSGDTAAALSSNGNGGVRYTNSTDFDAITSATQAVNPASEGLEDYVTDKTVYASPAAEMGAPAERTINVMTYIGYGSGDGSSAEVPLTDYKFNKKQFYNADMSDMPPVYSVTNQVYVITHGDGVSHSKVQITAMESIVSAKNGNRRIYQIKYAPLP